MSAITIGNAIPLYKDGPLGPSKHIGKGKNKIGQKFKKIGHIGNN